MTPTSVANGAGGTIGGHLVTEDNIPSLLDELRQFVRKRVAAGFDDASEIEEVAIDFILDDAGDDLDTDDLERLAAAETDRAFAEQLEAQRQWPELTDCDRLDRAFADLDGSGIVARQNFSCCQNCGHAEIGEEIEAAREAGTKPVGYTFYHWQDTESAVEGEGICLAYGDLEGDDAAAVRIGWAVVETLQRHGLAADWNGSIRRRIQVPLNWQRRVSARMAERNAV